MSGCWDLLQPWTKSGASLEDSLSEWLTSSPGQIRKCQIRLSFFCTVIDTYYDYDDYNQPIPHCRLCPRDSLVAPGLSSIPLYTSAASLNRRTYTLLFSTYSLSILQAVNPSGDSSDTTLVLLLHSAQSSASTAISRNFSRSYLTMQIHLYLRQVNEVNGGDNAFVRCVFVEEFHQTIRLRR